MPLNNPSNKSDDRLLYMHYRTVQTIYDEFEKENSILHKVNS